MGEECLTGARIYGRAGVAGPGEFVVRERVAKLVAMPSQHHGLLLRRATEGFWPDHTHVRVAMAQTHI